MAFGCVGKREETGKKNPLDATKHQAGSFIPPNNAVTLADALRADNRGFP
jgi:hypothetical protein